MNNLHKIQSNSLINIPEFREAIASWYEYAALTDNERRIKVIGNQLWYFHMGKWQFLSGSINDWIRIWRRNYTPNLIFHPNMVIFE